MRRDGTLRNPVIIWAVRLGDDLYVRSVNGRGSAWFRGAQVRHEGHIRAGGVEKEVACVEETAPNLNDQIDAAYRAVGDIYFDGMHYRRDIGGSASEIGDERLAIC